VPPARQAAEQQEVQVNERAVALIADYVRRRGLVQVVVPSRWRPTTMCWRSKTFTTSGCTSVVLRGTSTRGYGRLRALRDPRIRSLRTVWADPCDRDLDLEVFRTCMPCQAELVELALELYAEQEAEG